jgi:hypothetical protein
VILGDCHELCTPHGRYGHLPDNGKFGPGAYHAQCGDGQRRLDRLARNTVDMLELADEIGAKGAGMRSLADSCADMTTPASKLIQTDGGSRGLRA